MSHELESVCERGSAAGEVAEAAARVTSEVLETMFFADAVEAGCSHEWLGSAVSDRIAFEGSHSGELRLCVSSEAADGLACAFLGVEPLEVTELLRGQVILELTNILCGAILSHVWPESKLALRPPECVEKEQASGAALHCCFDLPYGKLGVWLEWRAGTPPS